VNYELYQTKIKSNKVQK